MAQEKNFENKIKSYLKSIGAYFIKTHGDRFSKVGKLDFIDRKAVFHDGTKMSLVKGYFYEVVNNE